MTASARKRPPAIRIPRKPNNTAVFAAAGDADLLAMRRNFDTHAEVVRAALSESAKEVAAIKAEIDKINEKTAALTVGAGRNASIAEINGGIDPKEVAALRAYARGNENAILSAFGRADGKAVRADMSTESDPDGGWTVLPTIEKAIKTIARDISPMRSLANVITIGTGSYETLVDASMSSSGWASERQARGGATAGPNLQKIVIPAAEMWAEPAVTQTLLDDSFQDLGLWLSESITTSFTILEGAAFVSGSGVGQPKGFLSYAMDPADDFSRAKWNSWQYIATGSTTPSDTQLADGLIAIATKLRAPYRKNATWLFPRSMALTIRTIKDSTGRYLWSRDTLLNGDIQETLLGFPIAYEENMPAPGANALPIALGDWKRAYNIIDRTGIRLARDAYTQKPFVLFYSTKRVGGGASGDFNAAKFLKFSAS